MAGRIDAADLPPEVRKKLGVKKPRAKAMDAEDVRRYAIRVMQPISDLTRRERARVLRQALRLNEV